MRWFRKECDNFKNGFKEIINDLNERYEVVEKQMQMVQELMNEVKKELEIQKVEKVQNKEDGEVVGIEEIKCLL